MPNMEKKKKKICFLCFSSDKNLNYLPFVN